MAFQCSETVNPRARTASVEFNEIQLMLCIRTDPLSYNAKSQQCWNSGENVRERRVGLTEKRNNGSRSPKQQNLADALVAKRKYKNWPYYGPLSLQPAKEKQ